jgi:hypothetical protein
VLCRRDHDAADAPELHRSFLQRHARRHPRRGRARRHRHDRGPLVEHAGADAALQEPPGRRVHLHASPAAGMPDVSAGHLPRHGDRPVCDVPRVPASEDCPSCPSGYWTSPDGRCVQCPPGYTIDPVTGEACPGRVRAPGECPSCPECPPPGECPPCPECPGSSPPPPYYPPDGCCDDGDCEISPAPWLPHFPPTGPVPGCDPDDPCCFECSLNGMGTVANPCNPCRVQNARGRRRRRRTPRRR